MVIDGWNVIDENTGVLWHEYAFTKGAFATTLVFRGTDGLVVISPGSNPDARALDALAELGPVRALVANNALHHLGQAAWRARFPEALSYCPKGAVKALEKKVAGVRFHPLEELSLPPHVRVEVPPGLKTGETMVTLQAGKSSIWYTGDLLTNLQGTPKPPLGWLFTWTDSAPGFRLFKPAVWFLVKDKKALRTWALEKLANAPPTLIVPAHGPPVEGEDLAEKTRAQLERL